VFPYVRKRVARCVFSHAGLNRAEFLNELYQRKVPAIQDTPEELRKEIDGAW